MNAEPVNAVQGLELVIFGEGGAELLRNGRQVWASDSDEEFLEEFGGDELLGDDDADVADVLDYLVEHQYMSELEADSAAVVIDEPDAERGPGDDEDDGDEEEGE